MSDCQAQQEQRHTCQACHVRWLRLGIYMNMLAIAMKDTKVMTTVLLNTRGPLLLDLLRIATLESYRPLDLTCQRHGVES